jgi:cell division protease FtsH
VTEQLPLVERHLYGEDYLHDTLAVRLGGRAAELVELGQGSTGGASDLASATDLAIKMVREFGLSKELGPVGYPEGGSAFLGNGGAAFSSRPFADETQARIDVAVANLLQSAEQRALEVLRTHRDELRRVADRLVEAETIDGSEVYAIAGVAEPARLDLGTTLSPAKAAAASTEQPDGPS